jgi:hypothetical protein
MITSDINKLIYNGNSSTKEFSVTFPFTDRSELKVYIHDIVNNSDTEITENWGFNHSTNTVIYPIAGDAISSSYQIVILRNTNQTQEKDHRTRAFTSEDVENIADKLTREVQDLNEKISRSVKFSPASIGEVDANDYMDNINEAVEMAAENAEMAASKADEASVSAENSAQSASQAATIATNAAESASNAAQSALDAAQQAANSSSSASDAAASYADIENWMSLIDELKEGDVKTYTAGTSTETYSGSLTEFPVENEYEVPINVFVNGQFKEIITEYTEDKVNNKITFTTALNSGDKVNIVSNISVVDLSSSSAISTAIATHDANSSAHSTLFSAKENISNKVTSISGSSTDTQYPSAKLVYNQLETKAATTYVDTAVGAKVAKTGDQMTGNLVINGANIQVKDSDGDTYQLKTNKDLADKVTFQILDTTSGSGLILDATNGNEPFYTDGINNPDKLLKVSDKAVANGLATLDSNSKVTPAQMPGPYIVARGGSGTDWWTLWSDNWCEQGGISPTIPGDGGAIVTLHKEMNNTDYNIMLTNIDFRIGQPAGVQIDSKTTTTFVVDYANASTTGKVYWEVKGYAKAS